MVFRGQLYGQPSDAVRNAIDKKFDALFGRDAGSGDWSPHVCISCDVLMKPKNVNWIQEIHLRNAKSLLKEQPYGLVQNEMLRNDYRYPSSKKGYRSYMKDLLLSPRALHRCDTSTHMRHTYTCCNKCYASLTKLKMPLNAISNNNFRGKAPKELLDLNHMELAYLSPVRTYGYCFTWQGGRSTNLQGTLGFYEVDQKDIVHGVSFLESLGAHVVIFINGKMTQKQRSQAHKCAKLRVDKLIAAIEWLTINNVLWKDVNLQQC